MIRVFPSRTSMTPRDSLAFVGDPPMFRPVGDLPVRVSVTFTWDLAESRRLARAWGEHYSDVKLGGPALDDPGTDFTPGRFLARGNVFTSRGCPHRCSFCLVPAREGAVRELPIEAGWNVCDSNLLACSPGHIDAVFGMLGRQRERAVFSGGLDTRLLTARHVDLLREIRVGQMFFACDTPGALPRLERAAEMVADFPLERKRCYVLIGYRGDTQLEAERRLEWVLALGFLPFAQLYRGPAGSDQPAWAALRRKWCRPAAYRATVHRERAQAGLVEG